MKACQHFFLVQCFYIFVYCRVVLLIQWICYSRIINCFIASDTCIRINITYPFILKITEKQHLTYHTKDTYLNIKLEFGVSLYNMQKLVLNTLSYKAFTNNTHNKIIQLCVSAMIRLPWHLHFVLCFFKYVCSW